MSNAILAIVTPAREDWLIIAGGFGFMVVLAVVFGALGRALDRLDERRAPTALTREQLLDRGAPPWPWEGHTWDELYRDADAETTR